MTRRPPSAVRHPHTFRAMRLLRAVSRLGVPGSVPAPPELIPAGARVLAQGYLNRFALPLLGGWLLPRWMRDQSDPTSPLFTPRSVLNLMVNQTARNWTALGIPGAGHPVEATVDPYGLLTPSAGGPSLDWWVDVDGGDLGLMAPSQREVQQSLQGGLPVVATAYEANGLRVSAEAWALPAPGGDWAALQVVLFNIADLPLTGRFYFALRPYNPEGISPLYSLRSTGKELRANLQTILRTWPQPEACYLSGLREGDLFSALSQKRELSPRKGIRDPHGFAHAALAFTFNIEPWEEAEFLAFMPMRPLGPGGVRRLSSRTPHSLVPPFPRKGGPPLLPTVPHPPTEPDPALYSRAKAASTLGWRDLLGGGMRVTLSHRALQNSWEANRLHLLALHDGDHITPGPDLYHSFWFRDAAYMAYALMLCGFRDASSSLLRGSLRRQRRNGAFVSHRGEWDSTGQVLWTASRHLELYPDPLLLEEMRPYLARGAEWIGAALGRGGGLMPAGISSEHLGPPDHYYWDALWSLAGLESAAPLLSDAHAGAARKLRATLLRHWERDAARLGAQTMVAAPGRGLDLGAVGTLSAWFPLRLLPPEHPLLAGTLAALERELFHEGALFVHAGHSGWGTYLNMRVAGCRLVGGLPGGWSMMEWLLRRASPTLNWPEAIHPLSGGGSAGDGHHGWASAEWLMLVRLLLIDDWGDTLTLAPHLPAEWLTSAGAVEVEGAPARHGSVAYTLEWSEAGEEITLRLDPKWRGAAPRVRLRLPEGLYSLAGSTGDYKGYFDLEQGTTMIKLERTGA
jgi:hypothetical protein